MSIKDILSIRNTQPVDSEEFEFWNWLSTSSGLTPGEANIGVRLTAINYKSHTCGPGTRTEVFFQGCSRKCPGCFNKETWDNSGGLYTTVLDVLLMLRPAYGNMQRDFSPRISFCGGEPLDQVEALYTICLYLNKWSEYLRENKKGFESSHIIVYTGYSLDDKIFRSKYEYTSKLLKIIDVVIPGEFREEDAFVLTKGNRNFIGSSNQFYAILDDDGDIIVDVSAKTANRLVNLDPTQLLDNEKAIRDSIKTLDYLIKDLTSDI
jgi:anaerobic ribonucleoside-triphosphate reductase activating protein